MTTSTCLEIMTRNSPTAFARRIARELEGSDIPVAGAHFPGLRFGRLLPSQGFAKLGIRLD